MSPAMRRQRAVVVGIAAACIALGVTFALIDGVTAIPIMLVAGGAVGVVITLGWAAARG